MLALKSMKPIEQAKAPPQLPSEVLDLVAGLIYEDSFRQLDSLYAFSLVSHQFRKSALPVLFGSVSHVIRDRQEQKDQSCLHRLRNHPHLLCYVHILHVLRPSNIVGFHPPIEEVTTHNLIQEQISSDLQVVQESLPLMLRLRRLRYAIYVGDAVISTAEKLTKFQFVPYRRRNGENADFILD